MKKFLYGCLIVLIAAALSVAANVALSSCDNPVLKTTPKVKTADVQLCLDSIVNPVLGSYSEALELQEELLTNAFIDSVFCSIPKETLKNVTSVVLKKLHYVTKDDIVSEFMTNRQIYDNLPPPDNASNATSSTSTTTITPTPIPGVVHEETTTVTEASPTRVDDKPSGYKDTTINGKHALIQVQ